MNKDKSKFTLRIDTNSLKKFRYIAGYNGRSANNELQIIINRHIRNFEERYGKIED